MNMLHFRRAPAGALSEPAPPAAAPAPAPPDLNQALLELARFGRPRVGMHGPGWVATVDMNTNTTGSTFEVRSDFNLPTPEAAVTQCTERVHAAVKAITGTR